MVTFWPSTVPLLVCGLPSMLRSSCALRGIMRESGTVYEMLVACLELTPSRTIRRELSVTSRELAYTVRRK